jgi:hypothetical protein
LDGVGVCFAKITDGLSNTILAGEKHVPRGGFGVGWLDCSLYNGDSAPCSTRSGGNGFGLANSLDDKGWKFGSWHPHICQFVMADGSVRVIPVSISPDVLGMLCCRNDGQVIPDQ